jgi:hypothetical protein
MLRTITKLQDLFKNRFLRIAGIGFQEISFVREKSENTSHGEEEISACLPRPATRQKGNTTFS